MRTVSKIRMVGIILIAVAVTTVVTVMVGCDDGVGLCSTETAPPSGTEPEELIRLVADATDDFLLDHALFTEVYDVVFEGNDSIPPALDIVEVEVRSEGGNHTFKIRTREGDVVEEMNRDDQRVSFGVYIDSDGNGVSEYLLTTTDSIERGVIVTPEFGFVREMPKLLFEDDEITMSIPQEIVGERFYWLAFSGYSPSAEAFHPTAVEDVFVVPDVDVVSSLPDMSALVAFYAGAGSCQIVDKHYIACCGGTCPGPAASVPLTTIPGTSQQGKLFYRKQCGTRIYEFWCSGCCFGSRVYGGGTTGWVGRCPYICGMNTVDIWAQSQNAPLDKVYHTIWDSDCSGSSDPKKHYDSDTDDRIDYMAHTYSYATDELESCNPERNETTGVWMAGTRCCPIRKPYKNLMDVPGSVDGSSPNYNCPVGAP